MCTYKKNVINIRYKFIDDKDKIKKTLNFINLRNTLTKKIAEIK